MVHQCDGIATVSVRCFRVGIDLADSDGKWPLAYGVAENGAVLIRPDNFIACRSQGKSQPADIGEAISRMIFLKR
jgi:hypothetical protein